MRVEALHYTGAVGQHPTACDHCGGEVEEIGLIAPRCTRCGEFSLSHITFGPPKTVEVDLTIEEER